MVSIVVTNRDGADHLRVLLAGLDRCTDYRSFELVLVDNGSTDESLDVLRRWRGSTTLIAKGFNQSFSAANNQGVNAARGELVLLANNDLEPFDSRWLGFLVESLSDDVAAVGPMLIYPPRPIQERPPNHPDYTVQHAGVAFERSTWGVRATNIDVGADPASLPPQLRRDVAGVTAACLLARRSDLVATRFDEQYWYGAEDWDLAIRLGNLGRVVVDHRAVLFHHEYGTQDKYRDDVWLARRMENHRWFNGLWAPALSRKLRQESAWPQTEWLFRAPSPPVLAVHRPSGSRSELADAVTKQATDAGWNVVDGHHGTAELTVAFTPPRSPESFSASVLPVAVVERDLGAWIASGSLDAAQRVFTSSPIIAAQLDAAWARGLTDSNVVASNPDVWHRLLNATVATPRTRIGVATCAPDWERAQYWGDTHLARGLMRAFRRRGYEAVELIEPSWRNAAAADCDVVVHLRGLTRRPTSRGQWNVLWIISHPDRLEPGELDDYDVVASASRQHAAQLCAETGREVHFLPQATDADRFRRGPTVPTFDTDVLYVANARWPARRAPRWLHRAGIDFDLYGRNWIGTPEQGYLRDEYIANEHLASAYRSARIVVADHHGSMRRGGFVSNRIFDVLASGGVVLSDDVTGLDDLVGDAVAVYHDEDSLGERLTSLLADAGRRASMADSGHRLVAARHTLDHRAASILELLDAS